MYGLVRTMYVHCTYICPLGGGIDFLLLVGVAKMADSSDSLSRSLTGVWHDEVALSFGVDFRLRMSSNVTVGVDRHCMAISSVSAGSMSLAESGAS